MIGHNSAWGSTVALPAEHSLRKQSTNPYSSSGILPQTSATTKSGKACIHFPFNIHFPPQHSEFSRAQFCHTFFCHLFLGVIWEWGRGPFCPHTTLPQAQRDSLPRGHLYLQGLGEESRGMCSRFVILQVETPDESESRLKAISLLFFFGFHCTTGLIVQTIQPFPKTQQVRAVSWWVRRSLQLRPVPKSSVLTSNRSTDTTEVKDSNSHCLL